MITTDQAKALRPGDVLYHTVNRNADGSPQRWLVNGRPQVWKTRPNEVRVPVKHGWRTYDQMRETDLAMVAMTETEAMQESTT